jgi:membrane-bound metal-dependent hydrolase YbcI (DUF457 family)
MKGITHFTIGVAAASCLPVAVEAGADGNPLYFILGGVFGLLPDTIDFKFYRFFYRCDMEIRPDPLDFDAQMIADGIAVAVNRAYESGQSVRLKLSTIQLAEDRWQSYSVEFDVAKRRVVVRKGPEVDLGGNKEPSSPLGGEDRGEGVAGLRSGVKLEYFATTEIDIFDGPVFEFVPTEDNRKVEANFLPWHRSWSHSLVIAFMFGLLGWVIWGLWAGVAVFLAYSLHVLVDQLGFMGSNLWFPFTQRRMTGAMKVHSGDALWNFVSVWLACLVIFWNLYASASWEVHSFTIIKLFFYGAVVPGVICAVYNKKVFINHE